MSVKISREELTADKIQDIRKYLCLQPTNTNYTSGRFYQQQTKESVLFYQIINSDSTTSHVLIPYQFASALFQRPVNQDLGHPTTHFEFTGSLYDHQKPVLEEAIEHISTKGTTTIGLYPGFGKTVVGAYLAAKSGLYTAVLYHRDFLGGQWQATFQEFTNATTWIVGTPPPNIFPQVTLCMDTKVSQLPDVYREKIGFLIIDEAHAFCTPCRVPCLLSWQPKYVVAETATLIRPDGMHSMIQAICGTHGIFKHSTKPFTVIKLNTGIEPEIKQNVRGQLDWSSLVRTLSEHEIRNRMILSMVERNPNNKIMILTSLTDHVRILYHALQQMGEKVDFMAGTKKSYSDSRILLGTVSKIGAGFDEKTACPDFNGVRIDMLLLVTSMKSPTMIEQSVGRVFRAEMPIVVDFVDNNPTIKRHWSARKKWYVSRNGNIQEVSMLPVEKKITTVYTVDGQTQTSEVSSSSTSLDNDDP